VDALRSPVDESIYACRLYDFACIGAVVLYLKLPPLKFLYIGFFFSQENSIIS